MADDDHNKQRSTRAAKGISETLETVHIIDLMLFLNFFIRFRDAVIRTLHHFYDHFNRTSL